MAPLHKLRRDSHVAPGAHVSRTTKEPAVTLRPATLDDRARLLAWRNDPETRRQSRTAAPVEPSQQRAWLSSVLKNSELRLFIVEDEQGHPVGTGRLDYRGQGQAELSLTVAPASRGRGLAVPIIRALGAEAKRLGWHRYLARVKPANVRSLRAFLAAGFVPDECVHLEHEP